METHKFYRADKRDFYVGDTVLTAGEFLVKNPMGSADIEKAFEDKRPKDLPPRSECLYVFLTIGDAKKHWSKMSGGKLYEVTVEAGNIFFRGDMSLVDCAYVNLLEPEKVAACAKSYWSGECGSKPVIEVLVKKAHVSVVISKNEHERKDYFKSWAIIYGY
jgi:hypothetical protein